MKVKDNKPTHEDFYSGLDPLTQKQVKEAIIKYGRAYKSLITANPRSRVKAVKGTHYTVDEFVLEALNNIKTTCLTGCAHCCHIELAVTDDEALVIYNHCQHHNIPVNLELLKKQRDLSVEKRRSQPKEVTRCVFLTPDSTCAIYAVRPMVCREYYVATDPDLCDTHKQITNVGIINTLDAQLLVKGVLKVCGSDNMATQLLKHYE